jgi:hypothetical protein
MVKPVEIELTSSSTQLLVDGKNSLSLKAARVFRSAFSRYSAAKESGMIVLILGLLLTGAAYTIYVGIIAYGVLHLISS